MSRVYFDGQKTLNRQLARPRPTELVGKSIPHYLEVVELVQGYFSKTIHECSFKDPLLVDEGWWDRYTLQNNMTLDAPGLAFACFLPTPDSFKAPVQRY